MFDDSIPDTPSGAATLMWALTAPHGWCPNTWEWVDAYIQRQEKICPSMLALMDRMAIHAGYCGKWGAVETMLGVWKWTPQSLFSASNFYAFMDRDYDKIAELEELGMPLPPHLAASRGILPSITKLVRGHPALRITRMALEEGYAISTEDVRALRLRMETKKKRMFTGYDIHARGCVYALCENKRLLCAVHRRATLVFLCGCCGLDRDTAGVVVAFVAAA